MRNYVASFGLAVFAGIALAGCSDPTAPILHGTPEIPAPTSGTAGAPAARFVPWSNNPYFPLVPGTTFHYRARTEDGIETDEVFVTGKTKRILGVTTRVVEDVVSLDGIVIERAFDWYAQDTVTGDVNYYGEEVFNYDPETGEFLDQDGSWEAGVDGAQSGVIMKGHPQVGDAYFEERYLGVAEDQARVLALDARVRVPAGRFNDCLQTENFTDLEPDILENKFYAPHVGLVKEVIVTGGRGKNELINITHRELDDDDDEHDRD